MFKVVVCSCGKSLRAYEGMSEIRCPACRQSIRLENGPIVLNTSGNQRSRSGSAGPSSLARLDGAPAENGSEIIVFGFDPPPPRVEKVQLKYQVVEVASESTSPTPREKPIPLQPDRNDRKFEREPSGPIVDLEEVLPDIRRGPRRRRNEWGLERTWYECLAYPVRCLALVAGLGFALTVASFGLLHVLREDGPLDWFFYPIGGAALTYACGFLTCVVQAGARGFSRQIFWPRADWKLLLEGLLAGLLSFLAGPIIPAAFGVYFWINSGEMALVDYLILFELMVVAVGYWLLVFFSIATSDSWRAMLPVRVMRRAHDLGAGRTFLALAIVLAIFFFHSWLAVNAVENHQSVASFLLLLICWSSLLYWLVFLMRWLGVSMYRRRKTEVSV